MSNQNELFKDHLFLHLIKEKKFKRVVEVGVASGTLANRVLSDQETDLDEYYAVDPWRVYVEAFSRPPHAKELDQGFWDGMFEKVKLLEKRHYPTLKILRMTSYEGALKLAKAELDCVYIDAVHDERNIMLDCFYWIKALKNKGVLSGHDYGKQYLDMARALDAVFGEDLQYILNNPDKSPHSYKNIYQGNWWVQLNKKKKAQYLDNIQNLYPQHLINNYMDFKGYCKYLWGDRKVD